MTDLPAPPTLHPLTHIQCEVGDVTSLGATAQGERRWVPLGGGSVRGPELNGQLVAGGVDWQWRRPDGVLEIDAHYVIEVSDGALIEVRSRGLRHGPPAVMEALARGEAVPAEAYFFRTVVRFATGAPAWQHLTRVIGIASGRREARSVYLDLYRLG